MTNLFNDQRFFMEACGQTTREFNENQFNLYTKLMDEEFSEFWTANTAGDKVECLDALIDILVVTIGAIHSMGADGAGAWNEVMRTNFAKIDPNTGKVLRRDDGKILKPEGWQAPQLSKYVQSSQ